MANTLDATAAIVAQMENIAQARPAMRSRRMADVVAEPIEWLWTKRIPKSALTLITGDPGLGKSQMTLDFASRVTRGAAWPDGAPGGEPGNVLLLSCEDHAAQVLKPRLEAAGADLNRIIHLDATIGSDDTDHHVSLETDLPNIETMIKEYHPALIVIDPLNAYLGKAETYKDNHVRAILGPMAKLAEAHGVAFLAVMHLNKDSSKSAMHRTMGSVAFVGAARANLLVTPDLERSRMLLTCPKANLGPKGGTLAFIVEGVTYPALDGRIIETSHVVWQADDSIAGLTADQAMELAKPKETPRERPRDRAVAWLEKILTPEPMLAREVERQAEAEGITASTLRRAKADLGIESTYVAESSSWTWALPRAGF